MTLPHKNRVIKYDNLMSKETRFLYSLINKARYIGATVKIKEKNNTTPLLYA